MRNWIVEWEKIYQQNMQNAQLASFTPEQVDRLFKNQLPYYFYPPDPIRTFDQVLFDGNAACGEASAAIGAALAQRGTEFSLCIKKDGQNNTHAVIISGSRMFDPYRSFYTKGVETCAFKYAFPTI
jgi:hypothetical protein